MTVIGTCQSKVPCTVYRIFCLFHTAKGQSRDQCFLIGSFYFAKKLLDFLGMNLILPALYLNMISKVIDKGSQLTNFLGIRCVMSSVHKRDFHPVKMLGNRLIGEKHKILNDLCRCISLVGFNFKRNTILVKNDLALREIKIDGAPFSSFFPQNQRQLLHLPEHGHQLFIFLYGIRIFILKDFLHGSIAHSAVHIDDGFHDLIINDLPFRIYCHQAAKRQPVHALV